ncbi:hypothetical protein ABZZ44_30585 [Streptomyces sp. NPDC006460]|uniref:hypothetical protein n=1 Tax=Streptomyces sp. NPDC006460 TaxID=3154304 RepID=UPI0033AFD9B1
MTEPMPARRAPRPLSELQGIYDLLEEVRLRPGMWLRRSSLQHLDSMLTGYRVALEVHGVDAEPVFVHTGPFSEWLWKRLDMRYSSPLGWAVEIEREAGRRNTPAIDLFFTFLDEFLAEPDRTPVTTEPAR